MLRIKNIKGPLIMALLPFQKYYVHNKISEPIEDPMERIKKIFVSTECEPTSKELQSLIKFTTAAGIAGMMVGGLLHTQGAVQKFIDSNQATRFYGHYDAKKELHLSVSLQFAKGALKFGWRTALFSAIFESVQILLTTYRGKPSVLHYIAGGGTAGLLFKMSLGIKGSLIGLIVGGVLGGIGGSVILFLLHITGLSLEDLQNIEQQRALSKKAKYKEKMNRDLADEINKAKLLYDMNKREEMQLGTKEENVKDSD